MNRSLWRCALISAVICILVTGVSPYSFGAAVSWNTDSDGFWTDASNWTSNPALPGPADDVTINRGLANPVVTLSSGTQSINSLTNAETLSIIAPGTLSLAAASQSSATLNLAGGLQGAGNLTVTGPLNWSAGTMSGTGQVNVNAPGALNIQGDVTLSKTLSSNNTATWSNGNVFFVNGTFVNNSTLNATVQNRALLDNSGTNLFTNAGTYNSNPGAGFHTEIRVPFTHSGTMNAQSGTLFLTRPGTLSNTISISANATLESSASMTLNAGTAFTGTGSIRWVNGTQTFNTPINFGPHPVTFTGGTLTGPGNLFFENVFDWSGGTVSGTGTLDIEPTGNLIWNNTPVLARALTNDGTINWQSGNVFFNTGATVLNNTVLQATAPTGILVENGSPVSLTNPGTINVNPGKGSYTEIRVPFTHSGTVNIQSGLLFITRPFINSSTINNPEDTTLQFNATTTTHNAGTAYPGTGFMYFQGGTHTFNTPFDFGNRLVWLSSTLTGSTNLTFPGRLEWFAGTISGTGQLIMPAGSELILDGDLVLNRPATLDGATSWLVGNIFFGGVTVTNNSVFDALASFGILVNNGGTNLFDNNAIVNVDPGAGSSSEFRMALQNDGTINMLSGTLIVSQLLTLNSAINVSAGTELILSGGSNVNAGAAFNGTGRIAYTAGTHTFNVPIQFGNRSVSCTGSTLTGTGNLTVPGEFTWISGTLSGTGMLIIPAGGYSKWGTSDKVLLRNVDNDGEIEWTGNNVFLTAATITNDGLFRGVANNLLVENGGANLLANNGTYLRNGPGIHEWRLPVTNAGLIDVQQGDLSITRAFTQTAGETRLSGGNILGGLNTPMNITGGSLTGDGNITKNVVNSAETSPGLSAGRLAIIGNFTQSASSSFNVEVGGPLSAQTDSLRVTGTAALAGALNVTLINGYVPGPNVQWQIVDGGVVSGTFGTTNLPAIPTPLRWEVVYHADEVLLRVILPGDANCDGVVNLADVNPFSLALVDPAAYLLANSTCDLDRADMDDDGDADGNDIQLFINRLLGF